MTLKIRETGSEGNHYKTICRMDIINKCPDLCKILKGRTLMNYYFELSKGNLDFRDINRPSNATFHHARTPSRHSRQPHPSFPRRREISLDFDPVKRKAPGSKSEFMPCCKGCLCPVLKGTHSPACAGMTKKVCSHIQNKKPQSE
jgi:hypothetical protein